MQEKHTGLRQLLFKFLILRTGDHSMYGKKGGFTRIPPFIQILLHDIRITNHIKQVTLFSRESVREDIKRHILIYG